MESQKPKLLTRLHRYAHDHKRVLIIISIVGLLLASGLIAFVLLCQKPKVETPRQVTKKTAPVLQPPKFYSPLTGLEVKDMATENRQVQAVMIENYPDARPQSGIRDAGVVFEAIAEGGITRFLCLYQEARPTLIGPVRSLRPYYVDWLASFDPSIAHIGGSANALKEIRSGGYKDIDQFFNAGAYWRATDRFAPHNVYTDSDKLDALNKAKGFSSSNFAGFMRKAEAPSTSPNATKIDIDISYNLFNVHYDYDKASNTYIRSQTGKPFTDREHGKVQPKVVVVIKVPTHRGLEDGYREQMSTLGNGKAYIFQDGTVKEGTWDKPDRRAQMTFKDDRGQLLGLNPGQTWISVTAPEKGVAWQ